MHVSSLWVYFHTKLFILQVTCSSPKKQITGLGERDLTLISNFFALYIPIDVFDSIVIPLFILSICLLLFWLCWLPLLLHSYLHILLAFRSFLAAACLCFPCRYLNTLAVHFSGPLLSTPPQNIFYAELLKLQMIPSPYLALLH